MCRIVIYAKRGAFLPLNVALVATHKHYYLETVHCIFQRSDKTVKVLTCRQNRDQGVDQISTILFTEFIQILFAVGVSVVSVDGHKSDVGWLDESNVEHEREHENSPCASDQTVPSAVTSTFCSASPNN